MRHEKTEKKIEREEIKLSSLNVLWQGEDVSCARCKRTTPREAVAYSVKFSEWLYVCIPCMKKILSRSTRKSS